MVLFLVMVRGRTSIDGRSGCGVGCGSDGVGDYDNSDVRSDTDDISSCGGLGGAGDGGGGRDNNDNSDDSGGDVDGSKRATPRQ